MAQEMEIKTGLWQAESNFVRLAATAQTAESKVWVKFKVQRIRNLLWKP